MKNVIQKLAFLTCLIIIRSNSLHSQCKCEKIIKENSTIINQCHPLPIGEDSNVGLGLNVGLVNSEKFICLTIRFRYTAQKIESPLTIGLIDGNSIDIPYRSGGLAYIGESEVAQGIYFITESQAKSLMKSKIKTVAFTLEDGLRRVYAAKSFSDVLIKHLNCLDEK